MDERLFSSKSASVREAVKTAYREAVAPLVLSGIFFLVGIASYLAANWVESPVNKETLRNAGIVTLGLAGLGFLGTVAATIQRYRLAKQLSRIKEQNKELFNRIEEQVSATSHTRA